MKLGNALSSFFEAAEPEAFTAGRQRGLERRQTNAFTQAGQSLQNDDYSGASAALLGAGELEAGMSVRGAGEQRQQAQQQSQQDEQTQFWTQAKAFTENIGSLPFEQRAQAAQGLWSQMGFDQQHGPLEQKLAENPNLFSDQELQADLAEARTMLGEAPPVQEAPTYFAPTETSDGTLAQFANDGSAPRQFEGVQAAPDLPTGMRINPETGQPEYIPEYVEGQQNIRASGRSQTTVNNNLPSQKGESAFQTERGKQGAQAIGEINERGQAAQETIANLSMAETLLDQIDYTGFGAGTLLSAQRVGRFFGIDIGDDIGAKEAMQRVTYEMGLALKENLPGPMSDADREFLLAIPPGINLTAEGNDALIYILRQRAKFDMAMQQSLNQTNPQSHQEYMQWENNFRTQYGPLFSPEDQARLAEDLGMGR